MLVGSSIISDVSKDKLDDTDVICKPGGKIGDAKSAVEALDSGYDSITLVVGGNDIPPMSVVDNYGGLIDVAKRHVTSSYLASAHG